MIRAKDVEEKEERRRRQRSADKWNTPEGEVGSARSLEPSPRHPLS